MGCIYYQDELGICCKKGGFNWENMEGSKCDYQLKNMNECQIGITVEQAEDTKNKLEAIQRLFNRMYQDYMGSRTTPLVSNYIPRFKEILETQSLATMQSSSRRPTE